MTIAELVAALEAAHKSVNAATKTEREARVRTCACVNKANELQKQLEVALFTFKNTAPQNTDWKQG